jgi:hypothetical protein
MFAALDSGHNSIRLFFADFRKGFDFIVDHNVMINELGNLNVHPVLTRWIKAFLTNRQQCVKVDCHESSWKTANGGLPQGTCLLLSWLTHYKKYWNGRLKFVDDTTALEVVPRCSPSVLPLVVEKISKFLSARGMELNPKIFFNTEFHVINLCSLMDNVLIQKEYTALSSWVSIYQTILPGIPPLTIYLEES